MYHLDDDDDVENDDCFSLSTTAVRPYDIDTTLPFPTDPFQRTSSYDEFDDMIIANKCNQNILPKSNINTHMIKNEISYHFDLLPPSMTRTDTETTTNHSTTIQQFQSTLEYVKERIREHVIRLSYSNGSRNDNHQRHHHSHGTLLRTESNDDESIMSSSSSSSSLLLLPRVHSPTNPPRSVLEIVTSWAQQVAQHPI
jgi:hypothetical protein